MHEPSEPDERTLKLLNQKLWLSILFEEKMEEVVKSDDEDKTYILKR